MSKTIEELKFFTKKMIDLFETGHIPYLIHFSDGNEKQLINIFNSIKENDYVFSTHRSQYHYILKGGIEAELQDKILNGECMHIFDKKINFLTSSILAGTSSIAAGVALAIKMQKKTNHVYCFIGDGAEDEGHFYEAVRFVDGWNLPCTFIIEDNNRSVTTTKEQRRGRSASFKWPDCVFKYKYETKLPHIGTGSGKMVKFKEKK
jgi:TPP-dependent pyruvate/acetoin dehydrogenase alpha subunit